MNEEERDTRKERMSNGERKEEGKRKKRSPFLFENSSLSLSLVLEE